MSIKNFWPKNKQVVVVVASIFIVSIATILFFTPSEHSVDTIKTNILAHKEHSKQVGGIDYGIENPYFVLNEDAKMAYSSKLFSKLLAEPGEDLEGRFLFKFLAEDDQEQVFQYFKDVIYNERETIKAGPFKLVGKNEEKIVFLSFISTEYDGKKAVLVEVNDVTDDIKGLRETADIKSDEAKSRLTVQNIPFSKLGW